MTTIITKKFHAEYFLIIMTVLMASSMSSAKAQSITVPILSFPQAETNWGCQFYNTCKELVVVEEDQ